MSLKAKINPENIPQHIAIIMDGNGRWAKQQGKIRTFGHKNGVTAVKEAVEVAAEMGVKFLTLYAFSTENWNRPKYEINALMELLVNTIHNETKTLEENNIRLLSIGNLEHLPKKCYNQLREAMKKTEHNKKMTLVLALSYSSREEILHAVKNIAEKVVKNEISIEAINESLFNSFLLTSEIPDPELLIRTSGEYRISNFLLWQIAYTELYFTNKLWPEFRKEDFYEALVSYQQRERRFGMIPEQLYE